MKYIKGVNRHGSETFFFLLKDKKTLEIKSFIKSSTTRNGIKSIMTEYEGINWYNKRNKNKIICKLKKYSDSYLKIQIFPNKDFFNIKFNPNYLLNKKYFDLTLNHYIQIWQDYKGKEYSPLHGDLSLVGNVMFNNFDEVLFIDWEQFENKKKAPTGFDPLVMLLENIWYETLRSGRICSKTMDHFVDAINFLKRAKLFASSLSVNPVKKILKFIYSNPDIWIGQHKKLPVLRLSEKYISQIDNFISEVN